MHSSKRRNFLKVISFIIIFLILMQMLLFFTVPHPVFSRLMMNDLYKAGQIDIAFVGASTVYRTFNPAIIDEKLKKNTFTLAASATPVMASYYALKELYKSGACETVFLQFRCEYLYERDSLFASKLIFDYMKPSFNKFNFFLDAFPADYRINACIPGIQTVSLGSFNPVGIFNRIKSKLLAPNEVKLKKDEYINKGYVAGSRSYPDLQLIGKLKTDTWDEKNVSTDLLRYYEKIIDLCHENGSEVILISSPIMPYSLVEMGDYEDFHKYATEFAQDRGVEFLDFNYAKPIIFTAESKYYYDQKHLNVDGSSLFSANFADFLLEYQTETYDESKYFYSTYDEMMQNWHTVFGVWLEEADDTHELQAYASAPNHTPVEYEFLTLYPSGKYEVYRPYSTNPSAEVEKLPTGEHTIRVNARLAGSGETFQQYFTLAYIKEG